MFNGTPRREFAIHDDRITVITMLGLQTEMIGVGRRMAKSDIIVPMADDDIDFPNRAETVYEEIENKGADIFCGSSRIINEQGMEIGVQSAILDLDAAEGDRAKAVYTLGAPGLQAGGYRNSTAPEWTNEYYYLADNKFFIDAYEKGLKIELSPVILSQVRSWRSNMSADSVGSMQSRRAETFRLRKEYLSKLGS